MWPVDCILRRTNARYLVAMLATLSIGLPNSMPAQTASDITAESFSPPTQRLNGRIVFSGAPGLAAPEGSERLNVAISGVDIDGGLPGTEAAAAELTARLTTGRIPVSEIFAAAQDLEAAYIDEGYVLARVVLPAQSLNDGGRLRLVVVDGFVERIDTQAVPPVLQPRMTALTDDLVNQRGLRLRDLERRLLLAGDTFGVALGSALSTGQTPGGTIIILEPEYRQITGFVGVDNASSDALGDWSIDAGVEFNGFLGYGEGIYLRGATAPDFSGSGGLFGANPQQRILAAGVVFPIGVDGLNFNLEVSQSDAAPETDGVASASTFQRTSARLSYPWIRSRLRNVTAQIGLDLQEDRLALVTGVGDLPVYADKLAVARAAVNGNMVHDDGAVSEGSLTLSVGLEGFDARLASDVGAGTPLSRAGADATFNKLEFSLRHRRSLAPNWQLSLAARGQTSFGDPLLKSEQFGLASIQDVSGFDNGALTGDSGWSLRTELSHSINIEGALGPIDLRPYGFTALGAVTNHQPADDEPTTIRANSYGVGLEAQLLRDPNFSGITLRAEVGEAARNDGGSDGSYLLLLGSYRF